MVNTGDQFITETSHLTGDVIDMEAYAEALVCKDFNTPFIAIKYISDIVGKTPYRIGKQHYLMREKHLPHSYKTDNYGKQRLEKTFGAGIFHES